MPYKVQLVGGRAVELHRPLSNGMTDFVSGITYEIEAYADVRRLVKNGQFKVVEDAPADKPAETVFAPPPPAAPAFFHEDEE